MAGLPSPLSFNLARTAGETGIEIAIFLAALLLCILFDLYAGRLLPSARRLYRSLAAAIGILRFREAFLLAAASALGEEFLFRGVLQAILGLPAATLLFALSHFPLRRELLLWPFYALFVGLFLAALRVVGGDLWSAVLLHFSVNLFGLLYLGRRYGDPTGDES